jgi:hypothetical protein
LLTPLLLINNHTKGRKYFMKLSIKTLCITLIALFLIIPAISAEDTPTAETALGIKQVMNSTDQSGESIIVRGFVNKVSPQDNQISLIDHPQLTTDKKTCTRSTAKACPMTSAKDSAKIKAGKTCPMAASAGAESEKVCPKTGKSCSPESCSKDGKKCDKAYKKSCQKACPVKAGKTCCSLASKTLTLPVQWDGNMPEKATFVTVVGKMTEKDGEKLFVAESVEVMSN